MRMLATIVEEGRITKIVWYDINEERIMSILNTKYCWPEHTNERTHGAPRLIVTLEACWRDGK